MKYIMNNQGVVVFYKNKPLKIEKSSVNYPKLMNALNLPQDQQESTLEAILENVLGNYSKDGFEIAGETVSFKGEKLPPVLSDKIRQIAKDGLPLTLFVNFWENLQLNPSANSVRELYDFLAYKELPITEDGCFLAYKGVDRNFWSISGNKDTKVIKGEVDNSGHIKNNVGAKIEVRRWDVDDDRHNHCSFGLHVGSLDYAQNFSQGNVVVVKVNPKDVVSVPNDYQCQKCRVSAYEVIDSFESEIKDAVTDEDGNPIVNTFEEEYYDTLQDIVSALDTYFWQASDLESRMVKLSDFQDWCKSQPVSFNPLFVGLIFDAVENSHTYRMVDDEENDLCVEVIY